ncbi:MAG: SRPBCC domain-containing protein, partial [Rhizobium sp.]
FTSAWVPSPKPFMVGTIQFEDIGNGKTRYTATVLHWTAEDRESHETMGFHEGWGQCTDQLASLAARISIPDSYRIDASKLSAGDSGAKTEG